MERKGHEFQEISPVISLKELAFKLRRLPFFKSFFRKRALQRTPEWYEGIPEANIKLREELANLRQDYQVLKDHAMKLAKENVDLLNELRPTNSGGSGNFKRNPRDLPIK